MSYRPKAPGDDERWTWRDVRDCLIAFALLIAFGALLSVPHPLTRLVAAVVE